MADSYYYTLCHAVFYWIGVLTKFHAKISIRLRPIQALSVVITTSGMVLVLVSYIRTSFEEVREVYFDFDWYFNPGFA